MGCECGTSQVRATTTAANGTWSIGSLPAGTYNVQYAKTGSVSGYYPTSITVAPGTSQGIFTSTYNLTNGVIGGFFAPGS